MKEDFYNFVMKEQLTSVTSESYSGRGWTSTSMMRWVYCIYNANNGHYVLVILLIDLFDLHLVSN